MQYPIIDLITDAYINNGWTGLELTYGKNLIDVPDINNMSSQEVNNMYNPLFTNGEPNTQYTFSVGSVLVTPSNNLWGIRVVYSDNGVDYLWITPTYLYVTTRANKTVSTIAFAYSNTLTVSATNVMLEKGNQATTFEPYVPPTTDIAQRLKLPLPHYFPHPVIDALQRSAAGTQTADDMEILRHYLTPLGIGGI